MFYFNDEGLASWDECASGWLLEYSPEKSDYFLNFRMMWHQVNGEVFNFTISQGKQVSIPSGFYVMIGDVYGEIDWILVDELIGRPIEIVILSEDLKAWSLRVLEFDSVNQKTLYWPQTNNVIPLCNNENVILVSNKDQYHKTKNDIINALTV